MHNPYFQVARTYLQRPFWSPERFLFSLFLFACFFLFSVFIEKHKFVSSQLFLFIALFSYWAIHVKEQLADSRASLTPGFRKVHGVVATIIALVFVILLPGIIALLIGWQPLGLVSITAFLFGIILWVILRLGNKFIPLIVAVWVSTLFDTTQNGIEKIVSGNEPVQAFTFLGIGAVLSITGIIRLLLLNEEKPEYRLNLQSPIDGRTKPLDLQRQKLEKSYSRVWRRWFTNRTVLRMIYHARHATDSYWSRMHRWNYSNSAVWWALFFAVFLNLLFTRIHFFNGTSSLPAIGIFVAISLPVILAIEQLKVKSLFMAQDLMMPIRRDSYLKELGISLAFKQFIAWAVIIAVSIVWMFTQATKPNPEFLIYSIPYSVMMQIWLFGLAVWILSFRSITMAIYIMVIAATFSCMTMINMQTFDELVMFPWWSLGLAALLACLGLLLTCRGYRRWLVADFN